MLTAQNPPTRRCRVWSRSRLLFLAIGLLLIGFGLANILA